jgi:hypothetical protein
VLFNIEAAAASLVKKVCIFLSSGCVSEKGNVYFCWGSGCFFLKACMYFFNVVAASFIKRMLFDIEAAAASLVKLIQWLKKMSQCLHDLERSDWCNLLK